MSDLTTQKANNIIEICFDWFLCHVQYFIYSKFVNASEIANRKKIKEMLESAK